MCSPARPFSRAPSTAIVQEHLEVGRMVAGRASGERKVRAPQDRVVANGDRPQGSGKCNRKIPPPRASAAVRVKWCGKSAPAAGRLAGSANPARSKTKQRGALRPGADRSDPPLLSGRLLEAASNRRPREMTVACLTAVYRTRLTGPLRDVFQSAAPTAAGRTSVSTPSRSSCRCWRDLAGQAGLQIAMLRMGESCPRSSFIRRCRLTCATRPPIIATCHPSDAIRP